MSEGWILDAHLRSGSDLVTVWVKEDSGAVSEHSFRWSPVIHVSGRPESLHELEVFLTGSVCRSLFGTVSIAKERRLISHGCDDPVEQSLTLHPHQSLSNLLLRRGGWTLLAP